MTRRDIAWRRLVTQHLITPDFRTPLEAVATLGAVQAQDYAGAKWALGLRSTTITDAEVDKALTDGDIIRTHVMRPTWHLVARDDIRWLLDLTAPRVLAASAGVFRMLGMDATLVRKSNATLAKALRNGDHRTRADLLGILERAGIAATQPHRSSYLLMRAELDKVICSGGRDGKQIHYALFDQRVPASKPLKPDEALHRLAMRYFPTRGPATEHDFSWWSGLTVKDARRAIEIASPELHHETLEGRSYWFGGHTTAGVKRTTPIAHLLPNYDEYFIGLRDRSAIGEGLRKYGVEPKISVLSGHILFIDGQAVGGWKRPAVKGTVVVQIESLRSISKTETRAVERSAVRLSSFLDTPVSVSMA